MKEEITIHNNDIPLAGTLTKPETAGPYPVVVVAHTSAASTRESGVYQYLAEVLSLSGVAVFIFDRRSSGDSTGIFGTATFLDLADDMNAAIDPKLIGL